MNICKEHNNIKKAHSSNHNNSKENFFFIHTICIRTTATTDSTPLLLLCRFFPISFFYASLSLSHSVSLSLFLYFSFAWFHFFCSFEYEKRMRLRKRERREMNEWGKWNVSYVCKLLHQKTSLYMQNLRFTDSFAADFYWTKRIFRFFLLFHFFLRLLPLSLC